LKIKRGKINYYERIFAGIIFSVDADNLIKSPGLIMNFLAHAYLSFDNDEVLVGNMISDFVKGKTQYDFPENIQKGIRLHRMIDAFTDEHPVTKEAKAFFKPAVGLYAGAFMDVVYDHFLANDSGIFSEVSLQLFAAKTYQTLSVHKTVLPVKFTRVLPYMIEHNWLFNYRTPLGIQQSFGGIVHRAAYLQSSKKVFLTFEKHYIPLQKSYSNFFPLLKEFTAHQLQGLIRL